MSNPNLVSRVNQFLKVHAGKNWGAPFVSSTSPLFWSYCYAVDAWLHADDIEREDIETALVSILKVFEHHGHGLRAAQLAIPALGDWAHVPQLWPIVAPPSVATKDYRPANCQCDERGIFPAPARQAVPA